MIDPNYAGPPSTARGTDPATSHQAAASINQSGARGRLDRMILRELEKVYPDGLTSLEFCNRTGVKRVNASSRFRPLLRAGKIQNGGTRVSPETKQKSIVWVLGRQEDDLPKCPRATPIDPPNIALIRRAVADYMRSEGCGCCENTYEHVKHAERLAELLDVPIYDDASGYDFAQFRTED